MNTEGAGDFCLALAFPHPADCLAALIAGEGTAAAKLAALFTGMGKASAGTLPYQLTLKFSQGCEDTEYQPPCSGSGVILHSAGIYPFEINT